MYEQRLAKLEDFLRSNPDDTWKWEEVYDVLSLPPAERPDFRRNLRRDWARGVVPWLLMTVQRGRGGIGGLTLNKERARPSGAFQRLWQYANLTSDNPLVRHLQDCLEERVIARRPLTTNCLTEEDLG
jgi:hypothetical protein